MSCQNTFCQDRMDDLLREIDRLKDDLDNAVLDRDTAEAKLAKALEAIRWGN